MKHFLFSFSLFCIMIITGCTASKKLKSAQGETHAAIHSTVVIKKKMPAIAVNTKSVSPGDLINFAETLIGIKYRYGAESVEDGFDCSGFVNYVFNHFNISVPRVTTDFTSAGEEVPISDSKPGDIILFTGTDPKSGVVGHVGIITQNNNGDVKFIHASTSRGVMISGMNSYFIPRFIKVNRVFQSANETFPAK